MRNSKKVLLLVIEILITTVIFVALIFADLTHGGYALIVIGTIASFVLVSVFVNSLIDTAFKRERENGLPTFIEILAFPYTLSFMSIYKSALKLTKESMNAAESEAFKEGRDIGYAEGYGDGKNFRPNRNNTDGRSGKDI